MVHAPFPSKRTSTERTMTQKPNRAVRRQSARDETSYDPLATRKTGKPWVVIAVAFVLLGIASFVVWELTKDDGTIPVYGYEIVQRYPHDPKAFTQGLLFHDGVLYESTGQFGESNVRRVTLETGQVQEQTNLPSDYFGEGLTRVGDQLVQVTWKNEYALYYDLKTLELRDRKRYRGEGWGLAYDGEHLVFSDGSNIIRFLKPETFEEVRNVRVQSTVWPIRKINELEVIDGEIWANIWHQDRIARIDPATGRIRSWIDLSGLYRDPNDKEAVLNGIAYDPSTKRIFVTGKRWPELFEIRLKEPE